MWLAPALSDTVIEAGVGHEDTPETSLPPCIACTFLDFFRGDHCGGGLELSEHTSTTPSPPAGTVSATLVGASAVR